MRLFGLQRSLWGILTLLLLISSIFADEYDHEYSIGDQVVLWVNKVGPYNNPQETYTYNTLPFCKAQVQLEPHVHSLGIGEILEGNELVNSDQRITFGVELPRTVLCSQVLTQEDVTTFSNAINDHYWYQMNIDDLPIWGLVGKVVKKNDDARLIKTYEPETKLIFTHKVYSISYNGPHIIHVNLTYSDHVKEVKVGETIDFTYETKWIPTTIEYKDRFDRYLEDEFFEHQIHWFSIFNSFMMVIFLCGLVALILIRTLRNDYAKYTHDEEEVGIDRSMDEDTGWKQIHGDVFRKPDYLQVYCALIGTGSQLLVLVTCVILVAIAGSLYVEPGGIVSTAIACYAISSVISGYVSGSCYYQFFYPNPSPDWIKTMLLTVSLLPATCFLAVFFMNWVAVYYGTTYAIPIGTIIKIVFIWAFISFPLSIAGTILGRNWSSRSNFPCRVNKMPRPIPDTTWYMQPMFIVMLTGILPFGSIFIEMYFIFTSFWNYKFYYVYGFMLLVYVILLIVSICVTIVSTYFVLNSENYRWQWISFLSSGSTAIYVYLYAIYFYFWKTKMSGFLQTVYYFGYMGLFCFAFFIMCGTLGYAGSSVFVKRIYRNIKCE